MQICSAMLLHMSQILDTPGVLSTQIEKAYTSINLLVPL